VLLFTTRREVRAAYQTMFARVRCARRTSRGRRSILILTCRRLWHSRIIKRRGQLQAVEEPGEPNAETLVEHLGDGLYRLTPRTGRTHQLRVHMAALWVPIMGDPLYPRVIDVAAGDFSRPLQLLAHQP